MAVLKREEIGTISEVDINDVHTILGPESSFEGKLVFEGTVRIDGNFKGQIKTDNVLVIGPGARVEADLEIGSVVINGEVIGDIIAKQVVEIHAPGKLRGNVTTPQLMIAKGVIFEGSCKMEPTNNDRNQPSKVTLLSNNNEAEL
ncbi:MAG: polymer-forming cytoskeletal protein [Deltaproteobacteria bacterium]|nr:polymer-forming cytoskeletal protein [Deltaproteobacteria bacterium]